MLAPVARVVGGVRAAALERTLSGAPVTDVLRDEARSRGRWLGTSYDGTGDGLGGAAGALATEHTELVCGVNLGS